VQVVYRPIPAVPLCGNHAGGEHPDVAQSLSNLAGLYQGTGRYVQAELLYQRALAILDKSLPSDHPNLAVVRENYAILLDQLGRGDEWRRRCSTATLAGPLRRWADTGTSTKLCRR
jgi:tetratricopeptide (TPR) repeat protein